MKKFIGPLLFMSACSTAQADLYSFEGSLSTWEGVIEGTVAGYPDYVAYTNLAQTEQHASVFTTVPRRGDRPPPVIPSFYDRGFQFQYLAGMWLAFEHPLPWIPNLRFAYTDIAYSGDSEAWAPTQFVIDPIPVKHVEKGNEILALDNVYTELSMDVIDFSLYYNVLDTALDIDLGITIRQMDGGFTEMLEEDIVSGRPEKSKTTPIDLLMPLLYMKAQFEIPFTDNIPVLNKLKFLDGLYVAATTSAISAGGATMIDFDAEIGYMFDFKTVDMGLNFGWRYANLEAENFQDLFADANISGVHAGIVIKF